ncbi:FecR domain-containing protein [Rhodanobacter sp. B05]|uniref:FecR family protein n=1 Tax=Rhodanobacter sp. B05 TaxID=1945859 RepID=UPI0009858953|nr:FecR domain-containing protein [Rhodanobacter sp. B05]
MRTPDEQLHALIAEQAAEWYVAHRDGELAPSQQQVFMCWLRASPVHVAEYLSIAGMARDIGGAARQNTTPLQPLLREADMAERVVSFDGTAYTPAPDARATGKYRRRAGRDHRASHAPRRPFARWGVGIAMSALAAVALFAGLQWFVYKPQLQSYATRHGEQRSLQLPDNTVVRLNSDSTIAVHFDRRQRRVEVTRGQAYFEVAKDPARPFGVQVDGLLIKDIGTTFDIYRQRADTTVTVAEGQVQVWRAVPAPSTGWFGLDRYHSALQGRPIVDLTAGHQARIAASGQVESQGPIDVQRATAWTQGNIAFENQAIAAVAAEFNRYNNLQISVSDPRIAMLPISGTFDAHDVSTFAAFLDSLPDVHVETHGQQLVVVASRGSQRRHK